MKLAVCRFMFLTFSIVSVAQVRNKQDLLDLGGPLPVFQLSTFPLKVFSLQIPVKVTRGQQRALMFRDQALKRKFEKDLDDLTSTIDQSLYDPKLGYLVEVQLFMNEFGLPSIPGGQLVLTVGPGTEPVDALAEFKRSPQLQVAPPQGLRDVSYYIWITKDPAAGLSGRMIPLEFTKTLRAQSMAEARRRSLSKLPLRHLSDYTNAVQRAREWNSIAEMALKSVGDADARQHLADLTEQFQQAENHFNAAYNAFQDTERAIRERQSFLTALSQANTVLSILQGAIQAGDLLATSNKPVIASGKPEADIDLVIQYTRTTTSALQNYHKQETVTVKARESELRAAEKALQNGWQQQNTKPPQGDLQIPKY